jgi:PAS domain S-box-containing protein
MKRFFHGSVRRKLVVLVLLATLPAFCMLALNELEDRRHRMDMARTDTATLLRGFSEVQRRVTDSTRTLLQTVAAMPEVRKADPVAAHGILATLLAANPVYTNVFLLDLHGNVVAGGQGPGKGLNFADRKQFLDAVATGEFSSGEYVVGKATLKPIFPFGMPVHDEDGAVCGVLIIGVDLGHYGVLFERSAFSSGAFFGICDSNGIRLFLSPPRDDTPMGQPIRPEVFLAASRADSPGTMISRGTDGVQRILAYEPVRLRSDMPPYIYMILGFDESGIMSRANTQALRGMATTLVSLGLALAIAWFAGGRVIARDLEKLARVTRSVGEQGEVVPSDIDYSDGEVGELAQAYDAMNELLAVRENERNAALTRLSESEEQYRTLLEHNPAGICLVDPTTMVVEFANPAFMRLLGLGAEDVGVVSVRDIHPADAVDAVIEGFREHVRESFAFSSAVPCLTRSGERLLVDISSAIVKLYGRELLAGFFADITERKQFENDLVVAKESAELANRAKDEFLANISHEVRTPLNGVMGMLQLIKATATDEEATSYVDIAIQSSRNLLRVLNDVLDFSKIEAGRLDLFEEPFDLTGLMRQCISLFKLQVEEKGLVLSHAIDPSAHGCYLGDEGRIRQVLFNLLGNAIKFTRTGSITLEVFALPAGEGDRERLFFSVTDTGMGIPEAKIDYVFDTFTQVDGSLSREYKGVGLGLPIVKRLVQLMGGTLVVDSEVGRGTSILFNVLVRIQPGDTCLRPEPAPAAAPTVPLRILLVEDERVNMLMARRLLEKMGHAVTGAENGEQCLDRLRRETFDVVLMDIQMPVMNGMEVTRIIREAEEFSHAAGVPIIALTAHASRRDREAALKAGMDEYISKPFEREQLEEALRRLTAR